MTQAEFSKFRELFDGVSCFHVENYTPVFDPGTNYFLGENPY